MPVEQLPFSSCNAIKVTQTDYVMMMDVVSVRIYRVPVVVQFNAPLLLEEQCRTSAMTIRIVKGRTQRLQNIKFYWPMTQRSVNCLHLFVQLHNLFHIVFSFMFIAEAGLYTCLPETVECRECNTKHWSGITIKTSCLPGTFYEST
jgi:uncharacterized protein YggU (UPF0235/DUF167 family)